MSRDHNKYLVLSRLIAGETPSDIAKDSEVSYPTILRYNREFKDAKQNGTLENLLNMEEAVLEDILATVREKSPEGLQDKVGELVENVEINITALKDLSEQLKETAGVINQRLKSMTVAALSVHELDVITESLCKIQNAFFNKNTTQVNVQNNYDASGKNRYSNFLEDKPSD
ncbi:terminase small subunit [Caudoviricetes sp.]|nr:terminase small subunit [Caudoviricetes sp.]